VRYCKLQQPVELGSEGRTGKQSQHNNKHVGGKKLGTGGETSVGRGYQPNLKGVYPRQVIKVEKGRESGKTAQKFLPIGSRKGGEKPKKKGTKKPIWGGMYRKVSRLERGFE